MIRKRFYNDATMHFLCDLLTWRLTQNLDVIREKPISDLNSAIGITSKLGIENVVIMRLYFCCVVNIKTNTI